MKLGKETVAEARRIIGGKGLTQVSWDSDIPKATLSDIYYGKENVSRRQENKFREWAGLSILPSFETVEVPPGCEVAIVRPGQVMQVPAGSRLVRKRKKRFSMPTEPIEAAEYLSLRTSTAWRQALVDELEESICDGLKLEDTFEYGYE